MMYSEFVGKEIRIPERIIMDTGIDYSKIPLFENISEDELNQLLYCMKGYSKKFEKDSVIILEDEKVRFIGIILKGTVNMIKEDIWGNQTLLTYLEEGELIGDIFAVQKKSDSYVTFVASTKAEILFVPAANIIHTCPRGCAFHQKLATNMFNLLGQKSVRLMEKIEISSKGSLREKILSFLSMQAQKQNSRYIEVPMNRTKMADYLGVNRSAMTRELSNMQKDGLIDFDKNTFVILKK